MQTTALSCDGEIFSMVNWLNIGSEAVPVIIG